MGTKNDPTINSFWSKVGFLSTRIVNPLAFFVPYRWTERGQTRDEWYLKARRTASPHSLLCNVSWRGGYMLRKTETSYLWVEGMRKTDSRFPVREIMRTAMKEKKSMPNQSSEGEPGNQNIRKFRYKNRNTDGSGRSYLKQLYGIKLYLH